MRLVLGFVLATTPLCASTIAVTDNGARVLFITDLRQQGTRQSFIPKVFLLDAHGISLVDDPGEFVPAGQSYPDSSLAVDLSADGSVRAISRTLFSQTHCSVRTPDTTFDFIDACHVSANGRYALTFDRWTSRLQMRLFDLATRSEIPIPVEHRSAMIPANEGKWVASDGSILEGSADGRRMLFVNPFTRKAIEVSPERPLAAAISRDGNTVVYCTGAEIAEFDVKASARRTLFRAPPGQGFGSSLSLSSDGSVLVLMGPFGTPWSAQAYILRPDGSALRQVTFETDGIASAVLTGDGGILYAWTSRGGLISIDLTNGFRSEFIAANPYTGSARSYAAGSSYDAELLWQFESQAASANIIREVGTVEVLAGRRAAPLEIVPSTIARFQVPWEAAAGDDVVLRWGDPFWERWLGSVTSLRPSFIPVAVTDIIFYAVHEDFRSIVLSRFNPAHAGEIIHVYGRGFGPVDPPVPTGVPSPVSPLSRVVTPCNWMARVVGVGDVPVDAVFLGLAPGLTGIYQADLRYPAGDVSSFTVRCVDLTSTFPLE